MTDQDQLTAALQATTTALFDVIDRFDATRFNQKPEAGGWSAGEVAEHLYIIERNVNGILKAPGVPAGRAIDKKVPVLRAALEDLQTKREAPASVVPRGGTKDPGQLKALLREQRDTLQQAISETDLTLLCETYPHPSLGRLTRLEWICFVIFHTQRHTQQLTALHNWVQ